MALETYTCVLCLHSIEETTEHLFLQCQFAKECWSLLGITIQADQNNIEADDQIKDQSHPNFLMMVTILMCWTSWSVRNDLIFK